MNQKLTQKLVSVNKPHPITRPLIVSALAILVAVTGFALTRSTKFAAITKTSSSASPPQQQEPTASTSKQTQAAKKPKRDLTKYAQAPTLTIADNATPHQRELVRATIRAFLKQQWQARGRGKIATISRLVPNFAPGETAYFIEPDDAGRWLISIEVQGQDSPQQFYQLEEIDVDAEGFPVATGQPAARKALNLMQPKGGATDMIL